MTWPSKTWVDGDTPSGDNLNDYLRDPMNDLSTHIHDGSAGQGSNEIAPDKVTLADQGASPSAAGELQRDGVNLEWYGAAVVAITEVDPGVGTAGPRTLGAGAQQAAPGDHTHPLTGDADVGDVKSPKTFYKDDVNTRLTGTMPTRAIVAGSDAYAAGYHAGNVGGLDAIDPDLAPVNIKSGITIFGKVGTLSTTVIDDVQLAATSPATTDTSGTFYRLEVSINASDSYHGVVTTPTFAAGSRAFGAGSITALAGTGSTLKAQLLMGGVQVAESTYITNLASQPYMVIGTRALSGSQQVLIRVWNYAGATRQCYFYGLNASSPIPVLIAVGSMKI